MNQVFIRRVCRGAAAFAALLWVPFVVGCPGPVEAPLPSPTPTAVTLTPEETADPILPTASPTPRGTTPQPGGRMAVYHVVPGKGDKRAHLEPTSIAVKDGENAAVAALNAMAAGRESPLPKGTRAESVEVQKGTAIVNFNRAFADNFAGEIGGDEREALIFNAITATLGQFEGVKQVQILVEGKKVALGGTQDTTEPLPVASAPGTKVSLRP